MVGRDTLRVITVTENFGASLSVHIVQKLLPTGKSQKRRTAALFGWSTSPA